MSFFSDRRAANLHSAGWSLLVGVSIVFPFFSAHAVGETISGPQKVNYCEVVTLPKDYDGKVLSVDVVLVPGEHTLSLFGADCLHRGYDQVTEAQLPNNWITLPMAERLAEFFGDIYLPR